MIQIDVKRGKEWEVSGVYILIGYVYYGIEIVWGEESSWVCWACVWVFGGTEYGGDWGDIW